MSTTKDVSPGPGRPGRPLLLLGLLIAFGAPVAYMVRIGTGAFDSGAWLPWVIGLGAVLVALAFWQGKGPRRGIALAAVLGLLVVTVLGLQALVIPTYEGPARAGAELPEFSAQRSDGTAFARADLADGQRRVLVFYRGWW